MLALSRTALAAVPAEKTGANALRLMLKRDLTEYATTSLIFRRFRCEYIAGGGHFGGGNSCGGGISRCRFCRLFPR
ncbi:MAG TPA: hypothetical protein DDW52_00445 [Planctomycetaceae bacterium]|nr:hypothetical protein [Planctomycetaceae bacterium]